MLCSSYSCNNHHGALGQEITLNNGNNNVVKNVDIPKIHWKMIQINEKGKNNNT